MHDSTSHFAALQITLHCQQHRWRTQLAMIQVKVVACVEGKTPALRVDYHEMYFDICTLQPRNRKIFGVFSTLGKIILKGYSSVGRIWLQKLHNYRIGFYNTYDAMTISKTWWKSSRTKWDFKKKNSYITPACLLFNSTILGQIFKTKHWLGSAFLHSSETKVLIQETVDIYFCFDKNKNILDWAFSRHYFVLIVI